MATLKRVVGELAGVNESQNRAAINEAIEALENGGGGSGSGSPHIVTLTMNNPAAAAANRTALQTAIDTYPHVWVVGSGDAHLGGYYPASGAEFPALISIPSGRTLQGSPGVWFVLPENPASSVLPFANSELMSNAYAVNTAATVFGASSDTQRNRQVTFETTAPHNFAGATHVLLRGDTSDYQWDGVYEITALPDATHVTITTNYINALRVPGTTGPTGTVTLRRANDQIHIRDVRIKKHQNTTGSANKYFNCAIVLNKVGVATVDAHYDGCIVGLLAANFDHLTVNGGTFRNGAVMNWMAGPFRDLKGHRVYTESCEESYYIYTNETAKSAGVDYDGTTNTGGPIRSFDVDITAAHSSIRALEVLSNGGHKIHSAKARVHAYGMGLAVEFSTQARGAGSEGVGSFGDVDVEIIHDPDPGTSTDAVHSLLVNPTGTGELSFDSFNAKIKTYNRNYVNASALAFGDSTGACSTNRIHVECKTVSDLTASAATQNIVKINGDGWTHKDVVVSNSLFRGVGSTQTLVGVDVSSDTTAVGSVTFMNCVHDAAKGFLSSVNKQTRVRAYGSRCLQGTGLGLFQLLESCTLEPTNCDAVAGMSIAYCSGTGKAWIVRPSCCSADQAVKFNGSNGANTLLYMSGGGNSALSGAGRLSVENRANQVVTYRANCADTSADVASANIARVDGAIVYNTNAAAGTLGAAGLLVGQGTAAGSWKLLADPTKSY